MAEQTYANHARWVPAFHFFVAPVLLLNVINAVVRLARRGISWEGIVSLLVALALFIFIFYARLFALRVQDRVIRMEERQRMRELLPEDLQDRILEFSPGQLVALRFASDSELPALARKVLDEKIKEQKAIKLMIKNWRADYLRA
ncbi:MAG TPA: DUF6526 family protein [Methylomirabilota bacterium]|nr:DUF6526 family protein [Methylomirabilota bacterium]